MEIVLIVVGVMLLIFSLGFGIKSHIAECRFQKELEDAFLEIKSLKSRLDAQGRLFSDESMQLRRHVLGLYNAFELDYDDGPMAVERPKK
jgi:hypothetical protein